MENRLSVYAYSSCNS